MHDTTKKIRFYPFYMDMKDVLSLPDSDLIARRKELAAKIYVDIDHMPSADEQAAVLKALRDVEYAMAERFVVEHGQA